MKTNIKLITDDDMSMQSELKGTVCTTLRVVDFTYTTQRGICERIAVFAEDLDELVEFLQVAKEVLNKVAEPGDKFLSSNPSNPNAILPKS